MTRDDGVWTNNRFDCPDSWELPDGRQVVTVLGSMYGVGAFDRETGKFTPELIGQGGCGPQQSMFDERDRRIQICSQGFALPGANYSGHQSLPHDVKLSADGQRLVFSHLLPELSTLHGERRNFSFEMSAAEGGSRTLVEASDRFGLNMHARVAITIAATSCFHSGYTPVRGAVVFSVSCGDTSTSVAVRSDGTGNLITGEHHLGSGNTATQQFEPAMALSEDGSSTTVLIEAFLDGGLTDMVLGDGEVGPSFAVASNDTGGLPVPAGNQPLDWAPTGTGVEVGVSKGTAVFEVELWRMERGVDACAEPGQADRIS